MATQIYRIRLDVNGTNLGRELVDTMETLSESFSRLERLFDAMTQQKDGATGTDTDFETPALLFGFIDETNVVSASVASAAYAELNSVIGNAGPVLEQACASVVWPVCRALCESGPGADSDAGAPDVAARGGHPGHARGVGGVAGAAVAAAGMGGPAAE
jgi:hypothetical protein